MKFGLWVETRKCRNEHFLKSQGSKPHFKGQVGPRYTSLDMTFLYIYFLSRAQANDLKLQKKVEYLEGKLKLQTEKKRYLAAKTELVKQKTLYYMAMSAIAGKQNVLQLNIPDE